MLVFTAEQLFRHIGLARNKPWVGIRDQLLNEVMAALMLKHHSEDESSEIFRNLQSQPAELLAASICSGTGALPAHCWTVVLVGCFTSLLRKMVGIANDNLCTVPYGTIRYGPVWVPKLPEST